MEKLFTVDNIAEMTGLTSRTIRSYISSGRLKGRKIGSQWRFTEADIESLFSAPATSGDGVASSENELVNEFLAPQQRSGVTICAVIDYPASAAAATESIRDTISSAISEYSDAASVEFRYEYLPSVEAGRFTLIGPIDVVSKLVKLIRKKI